MKKVNFCLTRLNLCLNTIYHFSNTFLESKIYDIGFFTSVASMFLTTMIENSSWTKMCHLIQGCTNKTILQSKFWHSYSDIVTLLSDLILSKLLMKMEV